MFFVLLPVDVALLVTEVRLEVGLKLAETLLDLFSYLCLFTCLFQKKIFFFKNKFSIHNSKVFVPVSYTHLDVYKRQPYVIVYSNFFLCVFWYYYLPLVI